MGVHGRIVGQSVVDHMGQIVYVESAGGHVGGHEQRYHSVAEFAHHYVALLLRQVAVERFGVVAVGYQFVGNLLRIASCAAEYDGVDVGRVVGYAFKSEVFVLGVDHVVDMLHIGRSFVAVAYHELRGLMHVFAGYAGYLVGHCGREHQHLAVGRNA